MKSYVLVLMLILSMTIKAHSVEFLQNANLLIPDLITETIKVDGELSEAVWQLPSLKRNFITFVPLYGDTLGPLTEVWLAYDRKILYFAFLCHDPEPGKIKTSVSKRDSQSNDDWIGVLIDGMATRQSTFEFYSNASGIQLDGITSATYADILDTAQDFVWESAGKITEVGFQVEIGIPLSSLRFKGGEETSMGIMFMRSISRYGKMGAWPEIAAGQTQFNFMATVQYRDLKKRLNLELLPNFTLNRDVERENDDHWSSGDVSRNLGLSMKYGITSAVTAEATIYPDFSQVESDAFQVEVNQRYPVFYSEKRPFFMEGMNAFDFALVTNGMMYSSVYTRFIVDPDWSSKLSGTAGRMQFALLAADDQAPGQVWDEGVNPNQGRNSCWGLARGKYSLGDDNSIGLLYSGQSFASAANHAMGTDLQYRFWENVRLTLSYLHSETRPSEKKEMQGGNGFNAMIQYASRAISSWAAFERWDENFSMASAFIVRSGINRGQFYVGPNFYLKQRNVWLQKIQPFIRSEAIHDLYTQKNDLLNNIGIQFYTSRSGFLQVAFRAMQEAWAGHMFRPSSLSCTGRIQLNQWLYAETSFRIGDKIYYDPIEPFLGTGHLLLTFLSLQPHIKLNVNLEYIQDTMDRKSGGVKEKIYRVDILNALVSYQFNKYFLIRGAMRYNDYDKMLLTDLLASFTLIPGTVLHLGYGSLYEQTKWQEGVGWTPNSRLQEMKNSLFFKVSYLMRIQ